MGKVITYYSKREFEAIKLGAKVIDNGVSLITTAGIHWCRNAIQRLRETSYNKGRIKHLINVLYAELKQKEIVMRSVMVSPKFYDAYTDAVIDASDEDVEKFRRTIIRSLKKAGIENEEALSTIETARVVLHIAKHLYEEAIAKIRKDAGVVRTPDGRIVARNYDEMFSNMRPHRLVMAAENLANNLYEGMACDLNTKESKRIWRAMARRFEDGVYIKACLKEAFKECPEFKNEIKVKTLKE